jgi:hypothetical protein
MIPDVRRSVMAGWAITLVEIKTKFRRTALSIAGVGWLAGCSLVYGDAQDKKQCESNADCPAGLAAKYLCGSANVCEEVSCDPACKAGETCSTELTCVAKTCSEDTECSEDGSVRCGYDGLCYPKWGCLEKAADWPAPTTPFHVKTNLLDITGAANAFSAVDVRACAATDPFCSGTPLLQTGQTTFNSTTRQLDITFATVGSTGFNGVIRIKPTTGDYVASYLHAPSAAPFVSEFVTPQGVNFGNVGSFKILSDLLEVTLLPNTTLLAADVYDCGGRGAPGVRVDVAKGQSIPAVPGFRFIPVDSSNIPAPGATLTGADGRGFAINLPENKLATLTVHEGDTGPQVATFKLVAQGAESVNFVNYFPSYAAVQAWMKEYAKRSQTAADSGI